MTRVYGIWKYSGKSSEWWLTNRVVFHTPFVGVAEAQCHRLNENAPAGWQVKQIGDRGQPHPKLV